MLTLGAFVDAVRAIHILAVIVSFGVLFVYPLLRFIGAREEPRAMPWFHRFQYAVHTRLQAPGLVVVLLAGIYLASDEHQWGAFYVGWGVAAVIAIGAIGGAYISPREKRLILLAEAEDATAPVAVGPGTAGGGGGGDEYRVAARQADLARLVQLAITVLTVFFMALHTGAA